MTLQVKDLLNNSVLVINLDKDVDRWKRIETLFPNHIRIPAVYGKELPNIKELGSKLKASTSMPSTIGCAMSHRKAWQYIADNKIPYGLILEDDITLNDSKNAVMEVNLPQDWDVFYLGHSRGKWPRNPCSRIPSPAYDVDSNFDTNIYHFTNSNNAPLGTWSYAVTLKAAQYLLDHYPDKDGYFTIPVDNFMSSQQTLKDLKVYGIHPSIITHCYDFGSSTSNMKQDDIYQNMNLYLICFFLILSMYFAITNRMIHSVLCFLPFLYLLYHLKTGDSYYSSDEFRSYKNIYKNVPGIYGVDPFDPFGNVWTDKDMQLSQELLSLLVEKCSMNGIKCIPTYGTLLGWARHRKVLPYDDDFDVMIDERDRVRLLQLLKMDSSIVVTESTKYFDAKISWRNKGHPIRRYPYNYPFIDIFFYTLEKRNNGKVQLNIPINSTSVMLNDFSLTTDEFQGIVVDIPIQYKSILNALYGKKWETECISSKWNHRLELEIDDRYVAEEMCKNVIA